MRNLTRTGLAWLAVLMPLLGLPGRGVAQTNFATLATDGAWTWFNDPRALFHHGKLSFGYVRASNGKTALDVFDLSTGVSSNLWYSGSTQRDDHNNPGLCAMQDGRLLAVYARHISDPYFAYRTSVGTNPVAAADWNAEQTVPDSGAGMTYANPFQLSAEGGTIYNFCRNLNFNPTIYTSTDGGSSWSPARHFIDTGGGGTRPYVKYASDGVGRIDFLYTDGHPRDVANSLYHMYYQGGGFYGTDGSPVKPYADLPIDHDAGERGSVIYPYSSAPQSDPDLWIPTGRAWCWEVASRSNGAPVCVFTVQRDNVTGGNWDDDRIYYYYARWTGSAWQKRFIAHAGRPLYPAEDDYAGGICLDPLDPDVIYISSNADQPFDLSLANTALDAEERYELYRGVTGDGGLTFDWTPVTTNSPQDNLRPYVPRRHGGEPCVIWFQGTYSSYTSYSCAIVGLFTTAVPVPPPPLPQPPITYLDASSGRFGTANTLAWSGSAWASWDPPFNGSYGADDQWEEESSPGWGNGPGSNWFESNREGTEDGPQLRTTVTGLDPVVHDVFAYFWVADGQGFRFGAALDGNPGGSLPLYQVGDTGVVAAEAASFDDTVMVTSADRTLYQVALGTATGGSIAVYVDDHAYGGYGSSCWYDGIGYRQHLAQAPADIAVYAEAGSVTVSWPETHLGWVLQASTNLAVAGSWSDVDGTSTNVSYSIPGAAAREHFRLRYPL